LPSELYLAEQLENVDPLAVHRARRGLQQQLATALHTELLDAYNRCNVAGPWEISATQIAQRSLKNTCLGYLALLDDDAVRSLAHQQYWAQHNMTDVLAALRTLIHSDHDASYAPGQQALSDFYTRWQDEPLAMNLWLQVQAQRPHPDVIQDIRRLRQDAVFDLHNPNKVRSLIGAWSNANPVGFHRVDHAGYQLLSDSIAELDPLNPQIASRLLVPLTRWRRFDERYASGMREALERLIAIPGLSKDAYEVVSKSLA